MRNFANLSKQSYCNFWLERCLAMIRFQAEKFLDIIQEHTHAEYKLKEMFKGQEANEPITASNREFFLKVLNRVQELAESIQLTTLVEHLNTAKERVGRDFSTAEDIIYFSRSLCDVLMAEVKAHVFLQIHPGNRAIYLSAITKTADVALAYPMVKHEILEAHLCFALERYTSCRPAELGLPGRRGCGEARHD